jgi:DNA polymerase-4
MPRATASTEAVLAAARTLVAAARPLIAERGLTLIGFAVANIDRDGAQQMELPFGGPAERRPVDTTGIDAAIDRVRGRYGTAAVTRGVLLGRHREEDMPMLPE